ncbi:hypothetical protein E5676_scaffold453G001010 [Cucumis melo var. makuwa]|uniref:Uncharacterized protein n=1 Tax=Cucumis melo var. makuwa TaxID=1194695 RepID=A0A5D3C641_CUCMM|nr:hypothetical protein E6C27_scaffold86G001110 [Cucumis melo var. makuwa]TYK06628.1 hypothetical protein E5676_scaffold453G001010 [Cucumis melo var. makuwa]
MVMSLTSSIFLNLLKQRRVFLSLKKTREDSQKEFNNVTDRRGCVKATNGEEELNYHRSVMKEDAGACFRRANWLRVSRTWLIGRKRKRRPPRWSRTAGVRKLYMINIMTKYVDQYINQKDWDNRPKFLSKLKFIARFNQKAKEASVHVSNKPLTWRTTTGKEILSEYPPEEEASFPHPKMPSVAIVSSPYKTIDEEKTKIVGVREIKNIQQQLNYSDKVLTILSRSIE